MKAGVTNFLTKSLGTAALGLIAYDAHHSGAMESSKYEKNHKAETLEEHYFNDMKLNSPSVIEAGVKKEIFKHQVDEDFSGFFLSIAGYIKGAASMLIKHFIPLSLAAGTVITKGTFSKFCGAGLLAYGGIFLVQEMFGVGKHH
jgi:hypothetical protein